MKFLEFLFPLFRNLIGPKHERRQEKGSRRHMDRFQPRLQLPKEPGGGRCFPSYPHQPEAPAQ